MQYIDQSHFALRYALYEGDADLTELTILCQSTINYGTLRIDAGILGASHFVKVFCGDEIITEVFACQELPTDPSCIKRHAAPLSKLKKQLPYTFDQAEYVFTYEIFKLSEYENTVRAWEKEIANPVHPFSIYLRYDFPVEGDSCSSGAKTLVLLTYDENQGVISTRTVHEYTNEDIVVINRSTFTIKNHKA